MKIFKGLIVCFIIFLITFIPVFNIKDITVSGINKVKDSEVLETAHLEGGKNIFYYFSNKYEKELEKNPYIKDAKIIKKYPNEILVNIEEKKLCAYVNYFDNMYIYLDEESYVLETQKNIIEKKPILVGVEVKDFTIGEKLDCYDEETFAKIMNLSLLLDKYGLTEDFIEIDLSNINDVHFYINNIDVVFGSLTDVERKLNNLAVILPNIPNYGEVIGYLYIDDVNERPLFKMID